MKVKKKIRTRGTSHQASKKSLPRSRKDRAAVSLSLHRAVENRFIGEHPEAFDPYIGQWVVLEGTSIVAHGEDAAKVVNEARAAGIKVPLIFRVEPKPKENHGRLGL